MFHMAVYNSVTPNVTGFTKINAENDGYLTAHDGAFVFPRDFCLYTWMVMINSSNTRRFKLESSHWRKHGQPIFTPCLWRTASSMLPNGNPDISRGPKFEIPKLDPIYAFMDMVSPGTLSCRIALFVGDCNFNFNPNGVFTLTFTSTVPAVADEWTKGLLVPEEPLPAGRYQVIGAYCFSSAATQLLVRFKFVNQSNMPGMPIQLLTTELLQNYWRYGHYGIWGEFNHTELPIIEFLGTSAGNESVTIHLDLVKVA